MNPSIDDAKRDRTFWRGMYMIAFVIGVVVPIASIICAGVLNDEAAWRRDYIWRSGVSEQRIVEGPLLLLGVAWSGTTLIAVAGVASGAWIIMSMGEKLGIDRSRGYLRGVFFMAFGLGGLVPLAGIIAAVATTGLAPHGISVESQWLLVVVWFGMIAACIAGLVSATWLVRSAAAKLRPLSRIEPLIGGQQARYFTDTESVR